MIPVQNLSLGQNAHRSFTAIETIHSSTVQAVNCCEYHIVHSVAQHMNNWRSSLLFTTCFESYRSPAETILTSHPFSLQYMNTQCRCSKLKTYTPTQTNRLLMMHSVIISKALPNKSRLHGYYIWDEVMIVELFITLHGRNDINSRGQTHYGTTTTSGGEEMTLFLWHWVTTA
jgi:hypothetical protein